MAFDGRGFLSLKTAADLREKARRDLAALIADPTNADHAFNFFVTARHVAEWQFLDKEARIRTEATPLMRICRNLADGAKHFILTSTLHRQIDDFSVHEGAFDPSAFSSDYDIGELRINLAPDEAAAAGLPLTVEVSVLASHVMGELDRLF